MRYALLFGVDVYLLGHFVVIWLATKELPSR
jgi:hypothetical protein